MKERPILFSGAMVRALLAGSKTQTRRVVKRQPWASCLIEEGMDGEAPFIYSALHGEGPGHDVQESRSPCTCPYGKPGDRLWVRETFRGCRAYEVQGYAPKDWGNKPIWFEADGTPPGRPEQWALRSRPSIHMPRWASRITLEVTGVRVERLHGITRGDAMAEGCPFPNMAQGPDPRDWYAELWGAINGPGNWDANPWVWVVEFRRLA
jgi:hypothetical protein